MLEGVAVIIGCGACWVMGYLVGRFNRGDGWGRDDTYPDYPPDDLLYQTRYYRRWDWDDSMDPDELVVWSGKLTYPPGAK